MAYILVIEDDASLIRLLRSSLERHGHSVGTAENGKEGLQLLKTSPPDLVITDLVMPEMEGMETIRSIRAINDAVPIIAVSGGGRVTPDDYLALARGMGADRALAKPFELGELLALVEQLIPSPPKQGPDGLRDHS